LFSPFFPSFLFFFTSFQEKFGELGVDGNYLLKDGTNEAFLKELGIVQVNYLKRMKVEVENLIEKQNRFEKDRKQKEEDEKETPEKELIRQADLITELPRNLKKWETPHVLKWISDIFPRHPLKKT
jgi:hypothetical protein